MKIMIAAARLPPAHDGVGDHADKLSKALSAAGHDVSLLGTGKAAQPSVYQLCIVGRTWGAISCVRAMYLLLRSRAEALVVEYTPFFFGPRSLGPFALLLAARVLRVRSAIIVHEAFYEPGSNAAASRWKSVIFGVRDALTIGTADFVAVPSKLRAMAITSRLTRVTDRVVCVPIGANIEPPLEYRRIERRPLTIVSFGVVMPRRRLECGLAVLAQLVSDGVDVQFDIIGRIHDADYMSMLQEDAARARVLDRVKFRGELTPSEITDAFAAAGVGLHCAAEGSIPSSGSLLALLAHGVPTVALRTSFDDPLFGEAVYFADNESAIANVMRLISVDPQVARQLSDAGKRCYDQNFAWSTASSRLLFALSKPAQDAARTA